MDAMMKAQGEADPASRTEARRIAAAPPAPTVNGLVTVEAKPNESRLISEPVSESHPRALASGTASS
jgi:hypothetical protein